MDHHTIYEEITEEKAKCRRRRMLTKTTGSRANLAHDQRQVGDPLLRNRRLF
jgi:hypothetical protein